MNILGNYFIFQIKKGDEKAQEGLFMNSTWHQKNNKAITVTNYDLIYGGALTDDMELDDIYHRFNMNRPADFKGHSLSVSDVIVIVKGEEQRCFFLDSIGFYEVNTFLDFWNSREMELQVRIADRTVNIRTATEGYEYDILNKNDEGLDGGCWDNEDTPILMVLNEIIMDTFRKELVPYRQPGFSYMEHVMKGCAETWDDIIPVEPTENWKSPRCTIQQLYKELAIKKFRSKNVESYREWGKEYVPEDLEADARAYVEEVFKDTGLTVKEVVFYGSRCRNLHRSTSDYDFLVEYEGDMNEVAVFNLLNQEGREYDNLCLDFNPVREVESGSLVEHLLRAEEYLEQKVNTYFCIHWYMKHEPKETRSAYCRAYDEADALKLAKTMLDFQRVVVTDVTPAKKHQITRQSIVLNCHDVISELEQAATF